MTPNPERLISLHLRLTEDTANAMTGYGPENVLPTPEGTAWLHDYARYRRLWRELELAGQNPATVLKSRLGYILPEECPEEPEPKDSGRTVRDKVALRWYQDVERGPEDAA